MGYSDYPDNKRDEVDNLAVDEGNQTAFDNVPEKNRRNNPFADFMGCRGIVPAEGNHPLLENPNSILTISSSLFFINRRFMNLLIY